MFTKEELKALFIILNERATFNLSGKEADAFVIVKKRVVEELKKLSEPEGDTVQEQLVDKAE